MSNEDLYNKFVEKSTKNKIDINTNGMFKGGTLSQNYNKVNKSPNASQKMCTQFTYNNRIENEYKSNKGNFDKFSQNSVFKDNDFNLNNKVNLLMSRLPSYAPSLLNSQIDNRDNNNFELKNMNMKIKNSQLNQINSQ